MRLWKFVCFRMQMPFRYTNLCKPTPCLLSRALPCPFILWLFFGHFFSGSALCFCRPLAFVLIEWSIKGILVQWGKGKKERGSLNLTPKARSAVPFCPLLQAALAILRKNIFKNVLQGSLFHSVALFIHSHSASTFVAPLENFSLAQSEMWTADGERARMKFGLY